MRRTLLATSTLAIVGLLFLGAAPATQPAGECCVAMSAEEEAMMSQPADAPATRPAGESDGDAKALFARYKSLVGKWDGDAMGRPTTVTYSLTGNGSAVVEQLEMHNGMITMYTLDGDRVIATHYCAAGNQPRMAARGLTDGTARFEFVDATGMNSPEAPHMHEFTVTFRPDGAVDQAWTFYDKGASAGVVTIRLTRAK